MLIHLIRHTTPKIESGICYGQTDLDVTSSFEEEKQRVLGKLVKRYDAIYTSPLQRCAKLAAGISAKQRITDSRIMEYNFGDWELRPWSDFKPGEADDWMNNFVDQPAPNGDSIISMQQRVMAFFNHLLAQSHETVAVVSHSGVQRIFHAHILQTPLTHMFRLQLDFGAVLEIKSDLKNNLLTVKHL